MCIITSHPKKIVVSPRFTASTLVTQISHRSGGSSLQCYSLLTSMQQLPDKTNGDFSGARLEDAPWGLIVMDYVKGTRLHDITMAKQDPCFQEILASRIAKILVALSTVKAPQGSKPGPMGGQTMSCLVWGRYEFEAPGSFDTLGDLQGYINEQIKVREHRCFFEAADRLMRSGIPGPCQSRLFQRATCSMLRRF